MKTNGKQAESMLKNIEKSVMTTWGRLWIVIFQTFLRVAIDS